MRYTNRSLIIAGIILTTLFFSLPAYSGNRHRGIDSINLTVDSNEATHLVFMREEEKLARDVYITLGKMYPETIVFKNIDDAEQQHTTAVRDKLAKYNIDDPNPSTDAQDSTGLFTGEDYGWYFTEKYNLLVAWGEESELSALYVGAFIEELDMLDIIQCPEVIQKTQSIGYNDCGLTYTENSDLQSLLESLLEGSKNHLRSYVGNIEAAEGKCAYTAQVLTQEEVDTILGRKCDQ